MNRGRGWTLYRGALDILRGTEYWREIEWYRSLRVTEVSEQRFLRESAWVVLCAGFRERVVRRHFRFVSLAFWDFESAERICEDAEACVSLAAHAFDNRRKLEAIVAIAEIISEQSFSELWKCICEDPIPRLGTLPFVGPVTVWHLAKNLGMSVAKPDRHLVSLAEELGFPTASKLCRYFSELTAEPLTVIDTVLWRAAAISGSSRQLLERIDAGAIES